MSRLLTAGLLAALIACGGPSEVDEIVALSIVRAVPKGRTERTTVLEVQFSSAVASERQVGASFRTPQLLIIEPAIDGVFRWSSIDTLQFLPEAPFRDSTRYEVRVSKDIAGSDRRLAGQTSFSFRTPAFGLASAETNVTSDGQTRVSLEFTHPVSPAAMQRHVTFTDDEGRVVKTELRNAGPGRVMSFALGAISEDLRSALVLHVAGAVTPANGGEALGKRIERAIARSDFEALAWERVQPVQDGFQTALHLNFSADVAPDAAQRALTIDPPLEISLIESHHGIFLRGEFRPGQKYALTLNENLRARTGSKLLNTTTQSVEIPSLDPVIRFARRGLVVPRSGERRAIVETVNVRQLLVQATKIDAVNLVHVADAVTHGRRPEGLSRLGRVVFEGAVEVDGAPNAVIRTPLAIDELDRGTPGGLYLIAVSDAEHRWVRTERWVLVTNLDLVVKLGPEHARVEVRSLANQKPIAGAVLSALGLTNEAIARGVTDARGIAVLNTGTHSDSKPSIVMARAGTDYAYLQFPLTTAAPPPVRREAFILLDRGTYRPGDFIEAFVLGRDEAFRVHRGARFSARLVDASDRIVASQSVSLSSLGAAATKLEVPSASPEGSYRLQIVATKDDRLLGQRPVEVLRSRSRALELEVRAVAENDGNKGATFSIQAMHGAGGRVEDLELRTLCELTATHFQPAGFTDFVFGGLRSGAEPPRERLVSSVRTFDERGRAEASCLLGATASADGPVEVTLVATASERGGSTAGASAQQIVHPRAHYLGISGALGRRCVALGDDAGLQAVVLGQDQRPAGGKTISASIYELGSKTEFEIVRGRFSAVRRDVETKIDSLTVQSAAAAVTLPYTASKSGRFRAVAVGDGGARATIEFAVCGSDGDPPPLLSEHELVLIPNQERYRVGDEAEISIRTPFAGFLTLSVERGDVMFETSTYVSKDTASVRFPITRLMKPNAYVVARLVRSADVDVQLADAAELATGSFLLELSAESHEVAVEVDAPAEVAPGERFQVRLNTTPSLARAQAIIALVDERALRGQSRAAFDPAAFFLGMRPHALKTYGLRAQRFEASGRRAAFGAEATTGHRRPRELHARSMWSGIIAVGPTGATVPFTAPAKASGLSVVAVVFDDARMGAAKTRSRVAQTLAVEPNAPEFLRPQDTVRIPVRVRNRGPRAHQVTLVATTSGPVSITGSKQTSLTVGPGGRAEAAIPLRATASPGPAQVLITATSGGTTTTFSETIDVRHAGGRVAIADGMVASASQTATFKIGSELVPESLRTRLHVGATPDFQFAGAVASLLNWEFSSLEAVVGAAFPLLHMRQHHPDGSSGAESAIGVALGRIKTARSEEGGLRSWPGSSFGRPFVTVFATHFLIEAERLGYVIESDLRRGLLRHLAAIADREPSRQYRDAIDLRTRAYALFVLSLAKRPRVESLDRALHDFDRNEDKIEQASPARAHAVRALLTGALYFARRTTRADARLRVAFHSQTADPASTALTDEALAAIALADVRAGHPSVVLLRDRIVSKALAGAWGSTRENALALIALGKLKYRIPSGPQYWGSILINEEVLRRFNSGRKVFMEGNASDWLFKDIRVRITGAGQAHASLVAEGYRINPLAPSSRGLEVGRTLHRLDGSPVEPEKVKRGELLISRVSLSSSHDAPLNNVAIISRRSAGLTLETLNPVRDRPSLAWLSDATEPTHAHVESDRVIFLTEIEPGEEQRFYYLGRALHEGDFDWPQVSAESLDHARVSARSTHGRLRIGAPTVD